MATKNFILKNLRKKQKKRTVIVKMTKRDQEKERRRKSKNLNPTLFPFIYVVFEVVYTPGFCEEKVLPLVNVSDYSL